MDPLTVPVAKNPKRLVAIIAGAVVLLIAVAIAVYVALGDSPEAVNTTSQQAVVPAATADEVKENLTELDARVKQAATDRATVKSALEDNKKQIKVEN